MRLTSDNGVEDGGDTLEDGNEDVGNSLSVSGRPQYREKRKVKGGKTYLNECGECVRDSREDVTHIDIS